MGKRAKADPKSDAVVAQESDDSLPPVKKKAKADKNAKPEVKADQGIDGSGSGGVVLAINPDGDSYADLGLHKRITVRKYQGTVLIDVREYYTDKGSGEEKPGKKGIALTTAGWEALKKCIPDIDAEVGKLQG